LTIAALSKVSFDFTGLFSFTASFLQEEIKNKSKRISNCKTLAGGGGEVSFFHVEFVFFLNLNLIILNKKQNHKYIFF